MKQLTAIICLCAITTSANAQVMITEIMYDPAGPDTGTNREWIEVQNNSTENIIFATTSTSRGWKLFEGGVNRGINPVNGYSSELNAGEFGVLVTDKDVFLSLFPNFSGKLFKSSFSLNNNGERLALKIDPSATTFVDDYTYTSLPDANDTGNSLQKNGEVWTSGASTPGLPFGGSGTGGGADGSGGGNTGTTTATTTPVVGGGSGGTGESATSGGGTTTPPPSTTPVVTGSGSVFIQPQLFGAITAPKVTFAGVDTLFQGKAFTAGGKEVVSVTYGWNFGDGTIASGASSTKRYKYPGAYAMTLDASARVNNNDTTCVEFGSIIVEAPLMSIAESKDGEGSGYVEIGNKTAHRVDMSSWIITRGIQRYELPKNTFILPFTTIRISHEVTRFLNDNSLERVELLFSNERRVALYDPLGATSVAGVASTIKNTSTGNSVPSQSNPVIIQKQIASIGGYAVPTQIVAQTTDPMETRSNIVEIIPNIIEPKKYISTQTATFIVSTSTATTSADTNTTRTLTATVAEARPRNVQTILMYAIPALVLVGGLGLFFGRTKKKEDEYVIIDDNK